MTSHVIWIITGTCGDYSDKAWWTVCWRMSETEAKAVVDVLNAESAVFKKWRESEPYGPRTEERRKLMTDPYFRSNYNETTYTCEPISTDARAFFDEFQARQER